jgi:hypothetical protein
MAGKGAYVLTQRAIMQKRQSYEGAKSFNNYFTMCMSLLEMADSLPKDTRFQTQVKDWALYNNKPFREFLDNVIKKEMPQCIIEKDTLEMNDKKAIKAWIFKYGGLIERVISDYVNYFHKRGAGGGL